MNSGMIAHARLAALIVITVLVTAATLTSFAESYRGLFLWAHEHGVPGVWAVTWPLMVDVFIAVGELALFVALADRWPARSRIGAWVVVGAGLAVSVAGNVGHVLAHSAADRATAAVPPLAAAAALAVGMGGLKRVVAQARPADGTPVPPASQDGALAAYRASVAAGEPLPARGTPRHKQAPGGPRGGHGGPGEQRVGLIRNARKGSDSTRNLTPSCCAVLELV